jgi:hypothetical protein
VHAGKPKLPYEEGSMPNRIRDYPDSIRGVAPGAGSLLAQGHGFTTERARGQRMSSLRGDAERRDRLPRSLTAGIAALTGVDLSGVKVFRGSPEPEKYDALAYASQGSIHLAAGQDRHLPHEAWHLAQQAQKRVEADSALGDVRLNTDPGLEREADRMGPAAQKLGETRTRGLGRHPPIGPSPAAAESGQPAILQRLVFTRGLVAKVVAVIEQFGRNFEGLRNVLLEQYPESVLLDMVSTLFYIGRKQHSRALALALDPELTDEEALSLTGVEQKFDESRDSFVLSDVGTAEERLNFQLHAGEPGERTGDVDPYTAKELDEEPDRPFDDDITQLRRKPGAHTGPKTYPTSTAGLVQNIGYTTDGAGSIDFNKGWKNVPSPAVFPYKFNVPNSTVNLKAMGPKIPSQKGPVAIKDATRAQHFAVANKIHFGKASADHKGLTWHHLKEEYKMVLVDANVHAAHGHNGGYLLWK